MTYYEKWSVFNIFFRIITIISKFKTGVALPVNRLVLSIQFPTDAPKHMTEAAMMRPYRAVNRKLPGASFIIYNPPANHHLREIAQKKYLIVE